jgi:AbiA family abortive infection protein
MFLQWYPFTRLSLKDKELIASEDFFNEYIKNGVFTYYSDNWSISDNYIMKGDGNFRNATLISPIMYLLMLSIGKSISERYNSYRPDDILVFYAGNFIENRIYYQKDYDNFYKELNSLSESYEYFIKIDIKDFFCNIDINILFQMLDNRLTWEGNPLSQRDILLYKELLQFWGKGEFPLVENSTTSSFLSTVIYLEDVDINLYKYIKDKETKISDFSMVRYVDDLYILFNSPINEKKLTPVVNRVINQLSSELKKINLSINMTKTKWKRVSELNEELKSSLYDEIVNGKEFSICDLVNDEKVYAFLERIEVELINSSLDNIKYKQIILESFSIDDVEYTPEEVFNNLAYEKNDIFKEKKIVKKLYKLLKIDYNFLKLDTKRLIAILLKTKSNKLIKLLLSKLFDANRKGIWNIYDTSLSVNYLLQRGFINTDLLNVISQQQGNIYLYYKLFCRQSFIKTLENSKDKYIKIFNNNGYYKADNILFYLFTLFMVELQKKNYLSAFAFYKNFFDRISAHLALAINKDEPKRKPNYKRYYKEGTFIKLYQGISGCEEIIKQAHQLRNSNPLAHSNAGLIDDKNTQSNITNSINKLNYLIEEKIKELT